jgi:hypothetical protein
MKITKSALRKLVLEQMQTVEERTHESAMDEFHDAVDGFNSVWNLFDGLGMDISGDVPEIDSGKLTDQDTADLEAATRALSNLLQKIDI